MPPAPAHHHPRPLRSEATRKGGIAPRRSTSCRQKAGRSPHAVADALVAANYARRTGHPREDLEQLAAIGLIKASRRYDSHHPGRSPNHFIAYARPYVNGEITHYLRDKGFLISVPGRWRELYARGQKLLRQGVSADQLPTRLGISLERWSDIVAACSVRVVAMTISAEDDQNP